MLSLIFIIKNHNAVVHPNHGPFGRKLLILFYRSAILGVRPLEVENLPLHPDPAQAKGMWGMAGPPSGTFLLIACPQHMALFPTSH